MGHLVAPSDSSPAAADAGSRQPMRILLVDDDRAVLESLTDWLAESPDVEVWAYCSAEEAITHDLPRSFDVCLLDYSLGGVDGLMLGAMIRELNPETRVVLMSGMMSPRIERLAMEHGFRAVVSKPVPLKELTALVFGEAPTA